MNARLELLTRLERISSSSWDNSCLEDRKKTMKTMIKWPGNQGEYEEKPDGPEFAWDDDLEVFIRRDDGAMYDTI